jgi:hypothetical protein
VSDDAKDPASSSYVDEALRLHTGAGEADKLVKAFADKIPHPTVRRCGSPLVLRPRASCALGLVRPQLLRGTKRRIGSAPALK